MGACGGKPEKTNTTNVTVQIAQAPQLPHGIHTVAEKYNFLVSDVITTYMESGVQGSEHLFNDLEKTLHVQYQELAEYFKLIKLDFEKKKFQNEEVNKITQLVLELLNGDVPVIIQHLLVEQDTFLIGRLMLFFIEITHIQVSIANNKHKWWMGTYFQDILSYFQKNHPQAILQKPEWIPELAQLLLVLLYAKEILHERVLHYTNKQHLQKLQDIKNIPNDVMSKYHTEDIPQQQVRNLVHKYTLPELQ